MFTLNVLSITSITKAFLNIEMVTKKIRTCLPIDKMHIAYDQIGPDSVVCFGGDFL